MAELKNSTSKPIKKRALSVRITINPDYEFRWWQTIYNAEHNIPNLL